MSRAPKKLALLVSVDDYQHLDELKLSGDDVKAFAELLRDPALCAFDEVVELPNPTLAELNDALGRLLNGRQRDDLILFYFSGHGLLHGRRSRLYFALSQSPRDHLAGTALSATHLSELFDDSYAERQVIVLDCCYSGQMVRGVKGGAELGQQLDPEGYGREILTASSPHQQAHEDPSLGLSLFTHHLVAGLRAGAGVPASAPTITIEQWYDYSRRQVAAARRGMTPHRACSGDRSVVIARNPAYLPVDDQVVERLNADDEFIRLGAVHLLARQMRSQPQRAAPIVALLRRRRAREKHTDVRDAIDDALETAADHDTRPKPKPPQAQPKTQPEQKPSLPAVQDIHGQPASFVQQLQQQTAAALGRPVVYRDKLKSGGEGPEMVLIPAGQFTMGSPASEPGRYGDEGPQHRVTIGKPFALGKTEVTFADYDRFAEATGRKKPIDIYWGRGDRPVINVSWEDAQAYAEWLSEQTGKTYRLPTEAEWEYAARAGSRSAFSWGDEVSTELANYDGNYPYNNGPEGEYRKKTLPVESFQPNAWGLYQMHGNVWEWVADWKGAYPAQPVTDPEGPASGHLRVLRGGSWNNSGCGLRAANRGAIEPGKRSADAGFRLAGG